MSILLTILLGGLAGYIASLIVNRNTDQGFILNVIVGIVGGFLANVFLAPLLGLTAVLDRVTVGGFLMAVLGAVALLVIVNLFTSRRQR